MPGSIKGITIEVAGSTTGLQKALSDVDKKSRDLQGELKQVDRALKFNPGNVELIAQKQQLLAEQVQVTTTRLDRLKAAQQQVNQQFQKGEINADQYRSFQREIITTESKLKGLKTQLGAIDDVKAPTNLKTELNKVEHEAEGAKEAVSELGVALGGLVAGAGLDKVIETATELSSLKTKIDISFDVPESSKQSVKDAIKNIEAYGIDGETALEGVRRQWALNKNASDATNTAVAKGAAVIASAYSGIDFTELIQETNEIGAALKISNKEALGMVNALLKTGFPPDQLDIIAEYGTQLKTAGYSAEQIQAIFAAGVDTKSWNVDSLIDGIKEGRINLTAFAQAVPKAITPLLKQAGISEKQFTSWGKAIAKGGQSGANAMSQLVKSINGIDDATLKNSLGVAVWATLYEDNGQNIIDTLDNASSKTVDLKANQKQLNESVKKMDADPVVKFNKAVTDLKTTLGPLLQTVTDFITAMSDWASKNPELAATIVAITSVIGILMGIVVALSPLFIPLAAAAAAWGISLAALSGIIAGVIVVIALIIAAIMNWSTVVSFIGGVLSGLADVAIAAFNIMVDVIVAAMAGLGTAIVDALTFLASFFSGIWSSIVAAATFVFTTLASFFSGLWNGIKSTAVAAWNILKSTLIAVWNALKAAATSAFNGIKSFLSSTWNSIKSTVSNTWNGIKSVISNAWSGIKSTISNGISSAYNTVIGYVGKFKTAGKSLLSALADGIRNGISAAVSAVSSGMDQIRQFLPFSPAKEGPLSDLDKSGESFFPTFSSKMNTGLKPMLAKVNAGFQQARDTIDANQIGTMGASNTVTNVDAPVNVTIQLTGTVTMNNEQQLNELAELLGDKIDQVLAKKNTIINRAAGVRRYGS